MFNIARKAYAMGQSTGIIDGRLGRFACVGLLTTLIDLALFSLLAVSAGMQPAAANTVSYSCGIATSFVLNRGWTFANDRGIDCIERHAMRFLVSNLIGLSLSTGLVALFVYFLPNFIAKTASVPLVFVWNYVVVRFWVFK